MNGSRVRGGEGRFITFYFIIFYTISFFILKKKYESYKSTLTTLTFAPFSAPFNSFPVPFLIKWEFKSSIKISRFVSNQT